MSILAVGIDVHKANGDFNLLWQGTMTRIRRSFIVKSAAIERIKSSNPETRASGFYHLNLIIDSQFRIYSAYAGIYAKIKLPKEAAMQIEALESRSFGRVKGFLFKQHKQKLQTALANLQERYSKLQSLMARIFGVVLEQRELLAVRGYVTPKQLELFSGYEQPEQRGLFPSKENTIKTRKMRSSDITSDNFIQLLRYVEEEEALSNEFISELKSFNDSFEALMSAYKAMQKKALELIESMKQNFQGMSLAEVKMAVCFVMRWMWVVYLLKIITVWGGTAYGPNVTNPEMQQFIHNIVHNTMLGDNFLDTLMVSSAVYNSGDIKKVLKVGSLKCQKAYKKGSSMFEQFIAQIASLRKKLPQVSESF